MAATVYTGTYSGSAGTPVTNAGDGISLTAKMNAKLLRSAEAGGGAGYSYSGSFTGSGDGGAGGIGMYFAAGGSLNSFGTITGGAGGLAALSASVATNGGDGGTGLLLELTGKLLNHGVIDGGTGGLGGEGNSSIDGNGGIGVDLNSGGSVINSGIISGGDGATDAGGFLIFPAGGPVGGNGGDGVLLGEKGTLKNHGTVTGGSGGYGGYKNGGGMGGIGVEMTQVGTVKNTGHIIGGEGGEANFQGKGGTGGAGVVLDQAAHGGRVQNTAGSSITGGEGGPGPSSSTYLILDMGGAGGDGVDGPAGGDVLNHGNITGGAGGSPANLLDIIPVNSTAIGGAGVDLGGGGIIHNSGTIAGGEGGQNGGAGGVGAIVSGGAKANYNSGVITGGEGQGVLLDIIPGVGGVGVEMTGKGIFNNSGVITAGANAAEGVSFAAGDSTLVNFGTINGGGQLLGNVAVDLAGIGSDRLVIDSASVFGGAVEASGSNNVLELSGTDLGTLNNPESAFSGFQTLQVDSGSSWALSGSVADLDNNGTAVVQNGTGLDITGAVDPDSSGVFKLTGVSSLEINSLLGSSSQIDFASPAGGNSLIVDNPAQFGVSPGGVYAGPQLEDFGVGDAIDLKGIGFLGLQLNYNNTTGLLQVSASSGGVVASLNFQNASLGAGSFHLGLDLLGGGSIITHN